VPRPDPNGGLPIIAILSVAQPSTPSAQFTTVLNQSYTMPGASWPNPQNLPTYAQVNVLERARWTLP
jgi:hypothetical protein